MKFSIKVQYGLQAMLELALTFGVEPVQIRTIANRQRIPIRFLEQILLVLKKRDLVVSTRGKKGGYVLARRSDKITLLEIIEALDGQIELISNKMKKAPALYEIFEKIEDNIKEQLSETNLDDLAVKKRQKDLVYTYQI